MGSITIIGGIGLILFGVRFLRKGLARLFGSKLIEWLSKVTANPVMGLIGGAAAGTIAPSSTATSLLTLQMLDKRGMGLRQMLVVLLGANIGFTLVIQLVSFQLQDYAGLLIALGTVGFLFFRRESWRGVGQCVLSLGFIFLALGMIGKGAQDLSHSRNVEQFLLLLEENIWLNLIGVSLLTVLLQSSNATVGLGLGLAGSGLLNEKFLIPWVIGTSLGVGITSLIAGWPKIHGRRLALGSITMKLLVALPFLLLSHWSETIFTTWPENLLRQTAMFNTEFNLAVALVALPLLGVVDHFTRFLVPDIPASQEDASFLDASVLESPPLALARATRETLRMADIVRGMLNRFWQAFQQGNVDLALQVQHGDDELDRINLNLKDYLSRIAEDRNETDVRMQFTLLSFSDELESIGDIIDKYLCDQLTKQLSEGIILTEADRQDLNEAYRRMLSQFESSVALLTTRNREEARQLITGKEVYNNWCRERQQQHYQRIHGMDRSTLSGSSFYLEYLNAFRRINSHLSSIGYAFHKSDRLSGNSLL
jgi:phosphate:Na+ symporter